MSEPVNPAAKQRPADYAELLREPISIAEGQGSYKGWEFDHGPKMHFYVSGMQWFMRAAGIQRAADLARYGNLAAEEAANNTNWTDMPASGNRWTDCSDIQFRRTRNVKPVFYQKAALVILACELALSDLIRTGRVRDKTVVSTDVYGMMAIIPACWHIDDFDRAALKRLIEADPEAPSKLRDKANQTAKTFLDHLATGSTVTLQTAKAVKSFLDQFHSDLGIGAVNARPTNGLGQLHATDFEHVDAE